MTFAPRRKINPAREALGQAVANIFRGQGFNAGNAFVPFVPTRRNYSPSTTPAPSPIPGGSRGGDDGAELNPFPERVRVCGGRDPLTGRPLSNCPEGQICSNETGGADPNKIGTCVPGTKWVPTNYSPVRMMPNVISLTGMFGYRR